MIDSFSDYILPFASPYVYGGVQIATSSQLSAGTSVGSTGARLVVPCDLYSPGSGSLAGLDDVSLTNPQTGEALVYNATAEKWINQAIGGSSSVTQPNYYPRPVYTTTGVGPTEDVSAFTAKSYSIQVTGIDGPPTSWTVLLEGGLNNGNFTTMLTHNTATGNTVTLFSGASFYPANFVRFNITALSFSAPCTGIDIIFTASN